MGWLAAAAQSVAMLARAGLKQKFGGTDDFLISKPAPSDTASDNELFPFIDDRWFFFHAVDNQAV